MTRLYEGLFLFDANLASRDWPGLERHVQELLERHQAELVYSERWPDRRLSYEIRGCRKGSYYLTYFNAPPESIEPLKRDCTLSDRVMRVLIVFDEALAEECERRQDAEAAASAEASESAATTTEAATTASATGAATTDAAAVPTGESTAAAVPAGDRASGDLTATEPAAAAPENTVGS